MLKRDILADAIGEVAEEYIIASGELLGYTEVKTNMNRKSIGRLGRTLLVAAIVLSLMIATAYAAGVFSMSVRQAEPDEQFVISWDDAPSGEIVWKDAKLVFTMEGPEECSKIYLKPGWLPIEPSDTMKEHRCFEYEGEGGLYDNIYVWDVPQEEWPEQYRELFNPYRVDIYYSPKFANDGALLLLYYSPEEITEGTLNGHKTVKFHATQHLEANDYAPEKTLHHNYFILFNETEGYAVVIGGEADMDVMEHIAENLEIVVTDEIVKSDDFDMNHAFLDAGVG